MSFQDQHFLILGLGESGLAMARWLDQQGAQLRIADTRANPARLNDLHQYLPNAEFITGAFSADLLESITNIAVSPGLSPLHELSDILLVAKERNIPVVGEIELFAQALNELQHTLNYTPRILAITGTNGKTTVTNLVGLLCQRAGFSVRIAGNISPAALDVLRQAKEENTLPEIWILELSSFQLHTTHSLNADAATILNISEDHLDWHGTMENYIKDKGHIFGNTTRRILNRDDPHLASFFSSSPPNFSFGSDCPKTPDSFGLVEEGGITWLTLATTDTEIEAEKPSRKKTVPTPIATTLTRLMPASALPIVGEHNAMNALSALALCHAIGLPLAPLLHGLRQYQGEPHRLELVATLKGVHYYDDSKGTNVGATVAALSSLGKQQGNAQRILLIAGGDGKGQNFAPLIEPISQYSRAVFLIGQDATLIQQTLSTCSIGITLCQTLEEAVSAASLNAREGDIVLLSPACASLDMFDNYIHRANVFKESIKEVGLQFGEIIT